MNYARPFIFLILFLYTTAIAQDISLNDLSHLDTLMIDLNFYEIDEFFAEKTSGQEISKSTDESASNLAQVQLNCQQFIQTMKSLDKLTYEKVRLLGNQYVAYAMQYKNANGGQSAVKYFTRFKKLFDAQAYREAIKNYYLAYYLKTNFVLYTRQQIKKNLLQAEKIYYEGKYVETLEVLQNINTAVQYPKSDQRKLIILTEKTQAKIREEKIEANLYDQKELVRHSLDVSVAFSHTPFSLDDTRPVWTFISLRDPEYGFYEKAKKLRTINSFNFSLSVAYLLNKKTQISLGTSFGKYSQKFITENEWELNHDITYNGAMFGLKYFFRDETGLRFYLSSGYNILLATRKNMVISGQIFKLKDTYSIKGKDEILQRAMIGFGSEYISSPESNIVYGFSFPVYINLNTSDLISSVNYEVQIKLGYIIL
jgi:hypothetical protein